MNTLKIVCIGGYGHSVCVLDEIADMQEVELSAISTAYSGENLAIIENHKACKQGIALFDDYKKMLAEISPDVAIVSSRLDRIGPIAIDCAKRGCHLICEKPLALDHKTLKDLYDAVRDNDVYLTAMLTMRSEPPFIGAREVYKHGVIGQAVLVNGRKSYKWGTRPKWFGDREKYGGTIPWIGIHAMDFINYTTDLDFTSAAAMQSNFAHPSHKDCQDNCGLVLEMSNGGHATISVDFFRPSTAPTHGDDWLRIVGTKGVIEVSGSNNNCSVLVEGEGAYDVSLPDKTRMFEKFLLDIRDEKKNRCVFGARYLLCSPMLLYVQQMRRISAESKK